MSLFGGPLPSLDLSARADLDGDPGLSKGLSTTSATSQPPSSLLSQQTCLLLTLLPPELRLQIYAPLLIVTASDSPFLSPTTTTTTTVTHVSSRKAKPTLTPALLTTCRLIYHEALPLLYAHNTFTAHPTLLTSFPYLSSPERPVMSPRLTRLIRRWRIAVRLDADARWTAAQVREAFSGAETLEVEAWRAQFGEGGAEVLSLFEGIRGVRCVRVRGSVEGALARWLEVVMGRGVGEVVVGFAGEEEGVEGLGRMEWVR